MESINLIRCAAWVDEGLKDDLFLFASEILVFLEDRTPD